ncbi:MAG TPA: type II toxin-antitoxin system antitoxin SocA domain-containing protein [Cyclobacteriaceae bacterium]|nr:type II toxin-antitoxin system antitoxin SocA domain-containing protein [Cyclobacteriaceae bacterium]
MSLLTEKEIGHRIASCRKLRGLSQVDLAQAIGIQRTSLTQIELGNRSLGALELKRISAVLGFSLDEIFSSDFRTHEAQGEPFPGTVTGNINPPPSHPGSKFHQVLLYILERCAGKPNVGETVLCKLLYFSDFNYYEQYQEHLTGIIYRKFPYGPVPRNLDRIIGQMIAENALQRVKCKYQGFSQIRYMPLQKADLRLLKASEKETIDKVIEQMSDWSAAAISAYSHKDIPWLISREGFAIDYALALRREPPHSVRAFNSSPFQS